MRDQKTKNELKTGPNKEGSDEPSFFNGRILAHLWADSVSTDESEVSKSYNNLIKDTLGFKTYSE